ncbi:WGxxGxxG family protein [Sphingomonas sp. TZW2008]|uniref:WGxxGxxG family protein n=1 Tax=Sphingomonas sp. TZW2008 TaxID=1917973 RepID=UPI000A26854E|nr:WGxxGxxG family protein [Sphingomonas sp. TZW2008]
MTKRVMAVAVAATMMATAAGTALAQETAPTTVATAGEDQNDDGDEGKWGLLGLLGLAGLLGLRRRDHDGINRR